MGYNDTFRTAAELTAEARAAFDVQLGAFKLADWLPVRENFGLTYEFGVNALTLTDAATFRTWDAEAPFGSTAGGQTKQGKLPPISRKLRVGEFDQLTLYGQNDAIALKFEEYARRLGAQVAARLALAQGNGVETGVITIAENHLALTVDFGRKGSHTVTAAALWSLAGTDALTDLSTWRAVYIATNGTAPAIAMMSTAIQSALQKNTSIITAALGRTDGLPAIVPITAVQSVFDQYGFGRIVINDDQVNVNGVATRVIASDKLVFLPDPGTVNVVDDGAGALGTTELGVTAESINAKYGIADGDKPGLFAADLDSDDPEGHNILVSGVGIPAITNINGTFVADVL